MAKVTMYTTAVCPYCLMAERLLRAKGVADLEKIRVDLEPSAQIDVPGLDALRTWTDALDAAEVTDVDHLQELLYGIDALVRVHLWRETGLPLAPPERRSASDV